MCPYGVRSTYCGRCRASPRLSAETPASGALGNTQVPWAGRYLRTMPFAILAHHDIYTIKLPPHDCTLPSRVHLELTSTSPSPVGTACLDLGTSTGPRYLRKTGQILDRLSPVSLSLSFALSISLSPPTTTSSHSPCIQSPATGFSALDRYASASIHDHEIARARSSRPLRLLPT